MLFTDVIDQTLKDKKPTQLLIVMTGIKKEVIEEGVGKHGYEAILLNPSLLNITEEEKERLVTARDLGDLDLPFM
ncbi:hypothetical protein GCM10008932_10950 [Alkalibacterium iburiense]|uniref:Uncharacterized protein n=1 Tax=Alkalibacterium iburiense TaxID=290589 RepID=A0ABN0XBL8_9LACT